MPKLRHLPLALLLCAASAPPLPKLVSVTAMGTVTQNPVVQGRDGTYSVEINGLSYWAFNDTAMTKANASGANFIDNTLSWASSLNAANGITLNNDQLDSSDLPTRFVPFTAAEANYQYTHNSAHCTATPCGANLALWPGPIVYDPTLGKVVVPFIEIWRVPTKSGWTVVGGGLAVGTVNPSTGYFALTRPVQNPGGEYTTLMWGPKDIIFTDQAFLKGDTYYAYGSYSDGLATNDVLARVPAAQILHKADWQYYAGNGTWSSNVADAVTVFQGGAAGSSVYYNTYLGEWMTIYSGNFSDNLYYRVAYTLEGPWSNQKLLYAGLTGYQNNPDYAGRVHPEFSPDGGQTEYVTYVHDTGFLAQNLPLLQVVFGK